MMIKFLTEDCGCFFRSVTEKKRMRLCLFVFAIKYAIARALLLGSFYLLLSLIVVDVRLKRRYFVLLFVF